jgi:hypothetical protein
MSLSNVKTVISTLTITIHGNGDVIYPDELEDTINEKNTPPDITDSSKEKNFNLTSKYLPCSSNVLKNLCYSFSLCCYDYKSIHYRLYSPVI